MHDKDFFQSILITDNNLLFMANDDTINSNLTFLLLSHFPVIDAYLRVRKAMMQWAKLDTRMNIPWL